eukprot:3359031-Rhodomonas_salina.2
MIKGNVGSKVPGNYWANVVEITLVHAYPFVGNSDGRSAREQHNEDNLVARATGNKYLRCQLAPPLPLLCFTYGAIKGGHCDFWHSSTAVATVCTTAITSPSSFDERNDPLSIRLPTLPRRAHQGRATVSGSCVCCPRAAPPAWMVHTVGAQPTTGWVATQTQQRIGSCREHEQPDGLAWRPLHSETTI